eukprot:jgi/Mesvir1/7396/Mv19196-RA.2
MWPMLMRNAKEGGLDVVQTYVFWNGHEPRRGEYDFSGRYDLVTFVREAHQAGLLVNLRIGPYVCAEWKLGGFPTWLREMKGIEFRTNNAVFMAEMQRFMKYIVDLMTKERLWYPQGGPIIMAQVENEYGNFELFYAGPGRRYVEWFSTLPALLGPHDIVWITCRQDDAPDVLINGCNDFYCSDFLPGSAAHPMLWTENWMGWFQRWGQGYPRRPVHDVAYAVAAFIARGGSYNNYYMYHGGTNFERTAARLLVTSYGYDAPLDEFGLPREPKYSQLTALHAALHNCSEALMAVYPPAPMVVGPGVKVYVYGSLFPEEGGMTEGAASSGASAPPKLLCAAFIVNTNEQAAMQVTLFGKSFDVPAWSVSILPDCVNEAFNTAQARGTARPHVPQGITSHGPSRIARRPSNGPHSVHPSGHPVKWRTRRSLIESSDFGADNDESGGQESGNSPREYGGGDRAGDPNSDGAGGDGSETQSIDRNGEDFGSDAGGFGVNTVGSNGDAATSALTMTSAPGVMTSYEIGAVRPEVGSTDPEDHDESVISYVLREGAPSGVAPPHSHKPRVRAAGGADWGDGWRWWAWPEPRHPANPETSWVVDVAPLDQTSVTLDSTDYMWYTRNFSLSSLISKQPQYDDDGFGPGSSGTPSYSCQLSLPSVRDIVAVYVNDEYKGRFVHQEVPLEVAYTIKLTLTPGAGESVARLDLLSTTIGLANYGEQFEIARGGITLPMRFSCAHPAMRESRVPGTMFHLASSYSDGYMWAHQVGLSGELFDLPASTPNQGPWPACLEHWGPSGRCEWQPLSAGNLREPLMWFASQFDLVELHHDDFAPGKGAWVLDLAGMGKGLAWVNGNCLGRTWPSVPANGCTVASFDDCTTSNRKYSQESCKTDCNKPSQTRYHVPRDWLKTEDNVVVLFEELGGDISQVAIRFMEHEDV